MSNATTLEVAMNIWSISDPSQKQSLMRKFLEKHGELSSKNDFIGFLVREFDLDRQPESAPQVNRGKRK